MSPGRRVLYSFSVSEEKLKTDLCPYCGGVILAGVAKCKYCLADLPSKIPAVVVKTHAKNPVVAALLSIVLPGLGQYYCGRRNKAIFVIFGFVVAAGLFYWMVIPWPAALVAAWASYDAYREALKS